MTVLVAVGANLNHRLLGLYGSISVTNSRAIDWCRSRGFYLSTPTMLPDTQTSLQD